MRGVLPFCDAATLPYAIDAQVISKTLIHLMERPPGRTSRHIERIIGAQKRLRLQDLLILATDTESLHPDIDTDIVLSTDFSEIHPWLVVWHGNEIPVLQYLHDHNYVCCRVGINRGGVAARRGGRRARERHSTASRGRGKGESCRVRVDGVTVPLDAIDATPSTQRLRRRRDNDRTPRRSATRRATSTGASAASARSPRA